jgi:hypothetical protein
MRRAPLLVVSLATLLVSCSSGNSETSLPATTTQISPTQPSTTPATTSLPTFGVENLAPLTGLIDSHVLPNSILAVKIDNSPDAWPQTGINNADIVFEENVEGWTRFMAIFHSQSAEPVGPIRSMRTQDIDILSSFGTVGLVGSGGNEKVLAAVNDSNLVNLSYTGWGDQDIFYRDGQRRSPHNLFASTVKLFLKISSQGDKVRPQFSYLPNGQEFEGRSVGGLVLQMKGSMRAVWSWNQKNSRFERYNEYVPAVDSSLEPVSTENVVAIVTSYRPSKADPRSPEAITVGSGDAVVFSGGKLQVGFWSRPDNQSPWMLTTPEGLEISLEPGRTWVELVSPEQIGLLSAGMDIQQVEWPS